MRRFLVRTHEDLIKIHRACWFDSGSSELSEIEKLVVVLEDHRFFRHNGVDLISFCREFLRMLLGQKHGGASTIDMQFVRTVTEYREKSIGRELYEMFLALIIQQRYDKWTILRSYMRIAYLGHSIRGVDNASWIVFGKTIYELSSEEASEIASMLVYPRPSVEVTSWRLKLERRKNYGKVVYVRYKQSLEKLPVRKVLN